MLERHAGRMVIGLVIKSLTEAIQRVAVGAHLHVVSPMKRQTTRSWKTSFAQETIKAQNIPLHPQRWLATLTSLVAGFSFLPNGMVV